MDREHGGFHNMAGIGSNQSGGAEYIYARDCEAGQIVPQRSILEIKANPNRGGEVRNITVPEGRAASYSGVQRSTITAIDVYIAGNKWQPAMKNAAHDIDYSE